MEKQIIIDGLLVNYLEVNPQAANTAILLHGWQSQASVWNPVIEKLSGQPFRLIAMDLPGFGKSQLPKTDWGVGDYSKLVKLFLEKLGITSAIIIGHSFGGRVGIKFSALYPNIVSKL